MFGEVFDHVGDRPQTGHRFGLPSGVRDEMIIGCSPVVERMPFVKLSPFGEIGKYYDGQVLMLRFLGICRETAREFRNERKITSAFAVRGERDALASR